MKQRDIKVTHCPSTGAYFGENRQVRENSLVLLLSNHGSPRLYSFHQVGGNGASRRPLPIFQLALNKPRALGPMNLKLLKLCLRPKIFEALLAFGAMKFWQNKVYIMTM